MSTTKVTKNYQVSIPSSIRKMVEVKAGDTLLIEYDREEEVIKLKLPYRGPRETGKLGRPLTVEDIEASIERGMGECLRF
ncbi:AbrB/MazE/SpoVT family DNA-binding domain-containing protein [Candidatus Bathyarchaeota archaeon]|nr:AbrB/MazE/SpoVT family DNA-binding domain-containing protein [Candidatus Bathyarchaeota archaeon]MBS7629911.1 AbrB/MazE/SpoVT family DNA-binding domain-containing protein [Candidatus Bathyarchaeota archaeon]